MQVQLRHKRSERIKRRGRPTGARTAENAVELQPAVAPRPGAEPQVAAPGQFEVEAWSVGRSARPSGEPLSGDCALYTCQCGLAFEAPVSTSVGCPNCGDTQAW
jgi:hypothetical protein